MTDSLFYPLAALLCLATTTNKQIILNFDWTLNISKKWTIFFKLNRKPLDVILLLNLTTHLLGNCQFKMIECISHSPMFLLFRTDSNQQPRWKSRKVILHEDSFFQSLKIDDTSLLNTIVERSVCQRCGKSRKYFCYDCHIPLESTKHLIPHIKELPCKIDVIKHPSEVDGKVKLLRMKF